MLYQITNDIWYKKWFLPKRSIIVFDRGEISSKGGDDEVCSLNTCCSNMYSFVRNDFWIKWCRLRKLKKLCSSMDCVRKTWPK